MRDNNEVGGSSSPHKDSHLKTCEDCPHCKLNDQGVVSEEIVTEASKCVGECLAEQIKILPSCPEDRTGFDSFTEPLLSIPAYFARICTYSRVTPETIIGAYINLKKVARSNHHYELTNFNTHRLLAASMMVFAKFYDDELDTNARWARIAGVRVEELNYLEIDFLNLCQFDLRIPYELFHETIHELLTFHFRQPTKPQVLVPLFNPSATFYGTNNNPNNNTAAASTTTNPCAAKAEKATFATPSVPITPTPCQGMILSPSGALVVSPTSVVNTSPKRHARSTVDNTHAEDDTSSHGGDDTSDHSHTKRKKSLRLLMNLFHRHHHHDSHPHHHFDHVRQHSRHSSQHADDDDGHHNDTASITSNDRHPSRPPSVSSRPSSPRSNHGDKGGKGGMPRNHSMLSLSGLMHALSPTSKPFPKKTPNLTVPSNPNLADPEVDK